MKKVTKIILIIFAVLIVLGVSAGIFAWNYYKEGIAPVSDKSKEVIVTVENGQTATSVLYTLEEAGLVNDVLCGKVYLKLNDVGNLQANSYILNENMSLEEIFQIMAKLKICLPKLARIVILNLHYIQIGEESTYISVKMFMQILI